MEGPFSEHPSAQKWNIWRVEKGERTWNGSILDPKIAFEWIESHPKPGIEYIVNNVPPPTGRTRNPVREMRAVKKPGSKKIEYEIGDELPRKEGELPAPTGKRSKALDRLWDAGSDKPRPKRQTGPKHKATPAPKHKAPTPVEAPDKELVSEAKVLLEQHKQDEAAEMAESEQD